jgi:hypothetical protein
MRMQKRKSQIIQEVNWRNFLKMFQNFPLLLLVLYLFSSQEILKLLLLLDNPHGENYRESFENSLFF